MCPRSPWLGAVRRQKQGQDLVTRQPASQHGADARVEGVGQRGWIPAGASEVREQAAHEPDASFRVQLHEELNARADAGHGDRQGIVDLECPEDEEAPAPAAADLVRDDLAGLETRDRMHSAEVDQRTGTIQGTLSTPTSFTALLFASASFARGKKKKKTNFAVSPAAVHSKRYSFLETMAPSLKVSSFLAPRGPVVLVAAAAERRHGRGRGRPRGERARRARGPLPQVVLHACPPPRTAPARRVSWTC